MKVYVILRVELGDWGNPNVPEIKEIHTNEELADERMNEYNRLKNDKYIALVNKN